MIMIEAAYSLDKYYLINLGNGKQSELNLVVFM